MKNIYLIGFMGTGKTTVGKILAVKLKREFIEMDETIEKETGKKITEIFEKQGEPYFRGLEKDLLRKLSKKEDLIVSCGGGLVCDKENLEILKKTGIVFGLAASSETILQRTKQNKNRPLLNVEEPLKKIDELCSLRMKYYAQAHHTIDTESIDPQSVTEKIINILDGTK